VGANPPPNIRLRTPPANKKTWSLAIRLPLNAGRERLKNLFMELAEVELLGAAQDRDGSRPRTPRRLGPGNPSHLFGVKKKRCVGLYFFGRLTISK